MLNLNLIQRIKCFFGYHNKIRDTKNILKYGYNSIVCIDCHKCIKKGK